MAEDLNVTVWPMYKPVPQFNFEGYVQSDIPDKSMRKEKNKIDRSLLIRMIMTIGPDNILNVFFCGAELQTTYSVGYIK